MPLPVEPGALHGHDPSLQIVDELHVVTEQVGDAVASWQAPGIADVGDRDPGQITPTA